MKDSTDDDNRTTKSSSGRKRGFFRRMFGSGGGGHHSNSDGKETSTNTNKKRSRSRSQNRRDESPEPSHNSTVTAKTTNKNAVVSSSSSPPPEEEEEPNNNNNKSSPTKARAQQRMKKMGFLSSTKTQIPGHTYIPDEFKLDAIGGSSPIVTKYQNKNNNNKKNHKNSGMATVQPLTPIQDAMSIDEAPIGKANDVASTMYSSNSRSTPKDNKRYSNSSTTIHKNSLKHRWFSWMCRTRHFQNICNNVFDIVDADNSGSIDENELYQGMLLIHLKLGTYAGPAACRPLGRERCHDVFLKMDTDDSGHLDKDEFREVMIVLFGNVIFRVLVQWCMTIVLVPMLARYIVHGMGVLMDKVMEFIVTMDEHNAVANIIELTIEDVYEDIVQRTPQGLQNALIFLKGYIDKVPDSVWSTIPLTLVSTVLGLVAVPFVIFKVDDFFQMLADARAKVGTTSTTHVEL